MDFTDEETTENRRRVRNNSKAVMSKGLLTAEQLTQSFDNEITDVTKGAELRLREFGELAIECATGKITAEEANKRYERHRAVWGEAIPGQIPHARNVPDKKLIHGIKITGDDWESRVQRGDPYMPKSRGRH